MEEKKKRASGVGRKKGNRTDKTFRIDIDLNEKINQIPKLKQSDFINEAIREKLKKEETLSNN